MNYINGNKTTDKNFTSLQELTCSEYVSRRFINPSSSVQFTLITTMILDVFISLGASAMNLLVLIVLWKKPSLKSNSNILLGLLALSDFVVGLVLVPCDVYRKILYLNEKYDCDFERAYFIPQVYFLGVSLYTVVLITLDRFTALFYPYWYTARVQKKHILIIGGIVWFVWFVINVPYTVSLYCFPKQSRFLDYQGYLISLSFFVALLFVSLVYAKIYELSRRHMRQITSQEFISGEDRNTAREAKAAKTISAVVACLFVCYIPMMVVQFLLYVIQCNCMSPQSKTSLVIPWIECSLFLNSLINPVLYWFRMPKLYSALRDIARSIFYRNATESTEQTDN